MADDTQKLGQTYVGRVLFESVHSAGVPFALIEVQSDAAIDLGPVTLGLDIISVSTGEHTLLVDLPDRQVVAKSREGSLSLCVDLAQLNEAAGWGAPMAPLPHTVNGAVDPPLVRMMKILINEVKQGYPSGLLLTEAACLGVVERCGALGAEAEQAGGKLPKLSPEERASLKEMLLGQRPARASRQPWPVALTLGALAKKFKRSPLELLRQFNATFPTTLDVQLLDAVEGRLPEYRPPSAARMGRRSGALTSDLAAPKVWTGPPVEPPSLWNACQPVHARNGSLAMVYWHRPCEVVLWRQQERILYTSRAGSVDLLPGDIRFDEAGLARWGECAHVIPLEAARLALGGIPPSLARPMLQATDAGLLRVVELFVQHWHAPQPWSQAQEKSAAELLLGVVGSRLRAGLQPAEEEGFSDVQREMVWRFVAGHLGRGVSAPELLRRLPFGRQSFASAFKASFGTTLRQFTLDRMIDASRWLLRRSSTPITRIAMEVGFASSSHFSSTFAARVGCTPRSYRGALAGLEGLKAQEEELAHAESV